LRVAETIRGALESAGLPHEMSNFDAVTISIGVAVLVPAGDWNADLPVAKADEALYAAKEQGRNRVMLAEAASASASAQRQRG
jgi:diguanylate cyclase (GGDEF)-like protein